MNENLKKFLWISVSGFSLMVIFFSTWIGFGLSTQAWDSQYYCDVYADVNYPTYISEQKWGPFDLSRCFVQIQGQWVKASNLSGFVNENYGIDVNTMAMNR